MNNLVAALFERVVAVWIERIWGSKLTTIAGILGITGTYVGQLTNYFPAPYNVYVTLGGVILAGIAAILSKDGASSTPSSGGSSSTQKTGVAALILLMLMIPFATACTGATVAQDIVNWTPTLESAVAAVDATAAVLDPAAAPIFAAATVGFDAGANLVVAEAKAYLATPNATVLARLQTVVSTFQQSVNAALLSAAKITNKASQQKATADINGVGVIINTILSLVASISSKAAVAQLAQASTVKLAQVEPYLDRRQAVTLFEAHYGVGWRASNVAVDRGYAALQSAGF